MQLASQGTSLHISHVELSHSGLFACQATNEAGTAGAEVEVSVHGELVSGALGQWETQWWGWWSWTRDLSVLGGLLPCTSKICGWERLSSILSSCLETSQPPASAASHPDEHT